MRMKLKLLRVSRNMTQQEIADALGVARMTYAKIENGQRAGDAEFWLRVQQTLYVSADELVDIMSNTEN